MEHARPFCCGSRLRRDSDWTEPEALSQHVSQFRGARRTGVQYCRHPNFGRSEQEHKHKGNENRGAKYGLTDFKDQIKLHLRPGAWIHL